MAWTAATEEWFMHLPAHAHALVSYAHAIVCQRPRPPKTQDLGKKLNDESGGMDLMAYVEFQRWAQFALHNQPGLC